MGCKTPWGYYKKGTLSTFPDKMFLPIKFTFLYTELLGGVFLWYVNGTLRYKLKPSK